MTGDRLAAIVGKRLKLPKYKVKRILNEAFKVIQEAVAREEEVFVRKFGVFTGKHYPPKEVFCAYKKQMVTHRGKIIPRFRFARKFQKTLYDKD